MVVWLLLLPLLSIWTMLLLLRMLRLLLQLTILRLLTVLQLLLWILSSLGSELTCEGSWTLRWRVRKEFYLARVFIDDVPSFSL